MSSIIGTAPVLNRTPLTELVTRPIARPAVPDTCPTFCANDLRDEWSGVAHRGPVRRLQVDTDDPDGTTFSITAERYDPSPTEAGPTHVYLNVAWQGWELSPRQARDLALHLLLAADEVES